MDEESLLCDECEEMGKSGRGQALYRKADVASGMCRGWRRMQREPWLTSRKQEEATNECEKKRVDKE